MIKADAFTSFMFITRQIRKMTDMFFGLNTGLSHSLVVKRVRSSTLAVFQLGRGFDNLPKRKLTLRRNRPIYKADFWRLIKRTFSDTASAVGTPVTRRNPGRRDKGPGSIKSAWRRYNKLSRLLVQFLASSVSYVSLAPFPYSFTGKRSLTPYPSGRGY